MSCSACYSNALRTFLHNFGFRHSLRRTPRSLHQRSLHIGSALGISLSRPKSLDFGGRDGTSSSSFDRDFVPFESSLTASKYERAPLSSPVFSRSHDRPSPAPNDHPEHRRKSNIHKGGDVLEGSALVRRINPLRPRPTVRKVAYDSHREESIESERSSTQSQRSRRLPQQSTTSHYGQTPASTASKTAARLESGTNGVKPRSTSAAIRTRPVNPQEPWGIQKSALEEKFGEKGWAPRKRLSPDALEGIRALHAQYPQDYTTATLADQFKVSPEAIRRILKSKWRPDEDEDVDRRKRWEKRGETIWGQMVQLGVKPPKKWRSMGVGSLSEAQSTQKKPRARPRHTDGRGDARAAPEDMAEAPIRTARDDIEFVGRSLSDRIL